MCIRDRLEHGVENLSEHVHFAPGIPIKAMLARSTNGVTEVLDKFSGCEFTCEYKYDGERAQVWLTDQHETDKEKCSDFILIPKDTIFTPKRW